MTNDEELLEMAHDLYKRLGGVGSKDARIVRALWERWQIERKLTNDLACACGSKSFYNENDARLCVRCGAIQPSR